ncbi:MAG: hypothetical protein ABW047_05520, partial [Nitrospiraceae bacterium]
MVAGAITEALVHSRRIDEGVTMPVSKQGNVTAPLRTRLPRRIATVLRDAGKSADRLKMPAYAVGGFVRDLLRGHPTLDLDLVVEGDGLKFARALAQGLHAQVKVHERFRTATVSLSDGFKLDIATARTERYEYPAALPTVRPSSIQEDLYRRDFTINTLAICLNRRSFWKLLDLYGGQRDITKRTIRVLHSQSFIDDPTRIFRAIRFELRLGFRISDETQALIKEVVEKDLIDQVSGQRLLGELRSLLSERDARLAINRFAELDLLRFIHPKLAWSRRLEGILKRVEGTMGWYVERYPARGIEGWLLYMMAFMDMLPRRSVEEALKRFAYGKWEAKCIRATRFEVNMITSRLSRRPLPRPAETTRVLSRFADAVLLYLMATCRSSAIKQQLSAYFDIYQQVKPVTTGKDLKAMGLKPGPRFTRILSQLRDARLNGEVRTEAEERRMARTLSSRTK